MDQDIERAVDAALLAGEPCGDGHPPPPPLWLPLGPITNLPDVDQYEPAELEQQLPQPQET